MTNKNMESVREFEEFFTKERSVNFSKGETERLKTLIEKYKNVLLCKKTDGSSSKQKELAWRSIEQEYNAIADIPRTVKQLKYKFENMKRYAKKEASKERQEMRHTGGGQPPSLPPASEEATDWLRSVMSASIDGNDAVYDDDAIITIPKTDKTRANQDTDEAQSIHKKPKLNKNIPINIIDAIDTMPSTSTYKSNEYETMPVIIDEDPLNKTSGSVFDCSTPHSSLKRPMAPPLKRLLKKKQGVGDNIIKRTLREKKILVLDDLHHLEIEKIKQNISQQKELHEQQMRHNEEKHKLELLKLQLEIEILQAKK